MPSPSSARTRSIQSLAVVAAVGLPALMRSLLPELVSGPITAPHLMIAQFALLAIAGAGAHRLARMLDRPAPPWHRWAVDAVSLAGAQSVLVGARAATDSRASIALDPDAVSLVVAAPIVEEILYRGLLPALLTPPRGIAPSVPHRIGIAAVSSAAFAAAHLGGPGHAGAGAPRAFALTFGCGLAFHLLRDRGGGLAASMAAHAGLNAMTLTARGW